MGTVDLTPVYSALQQADAAGNTADAQQLADYIRSQTPAAAPAAPATDPNATGASGFGHGVMSAAGNAANTVAGVMGAPDLGQAAQQFFSTIGGAAPGTGSGRAGDFAGRVALNTPMAGANPAAWVPVGSGVAAGEAVKDSGGGPVGQFLSAVLGGGLAGAAQGGARGALESQATTPPPGSKEAAIDALQAEGVPVNLAQATGNKLALQVDRASQMITKGSEQFAGKQQQAFNGAVLRRVGAPDATAATPDVLTDAKTRIGNGMDEIEGRSGADFDTQLAGDIQAIQRRLPRITAESQQGPLQQNIQDMISAARENGGTIPGAVVRQIRANLLDLSSQQQPGASQALEALQNAVSRSSSPADLQAYTGLRQQYRALKQIQDATDPTTGNITPLRLMQVLGQAKNDNQVLYGKGDQALVSLARNAAKALPDRLGNSGTAERFIPMLTAFEDLQQGRPVTALAKTVVGATGVAGAARAFRNQRVVNALTSDRLSDTLSGIRGDLLPGAGYGAYGTAAASADQFLRQLDQIEQLRRNSQTGNSSGNSKGSPAVVTASSVVGAGP